MRLSVFMRFKPNFQFSIGAFSALIFLIGSSNLSWAKQVELESLDKVEQDLKISQQHHSQLQAKEKRLEKELQDLRSVLIDAADEVRILEEDLLGLADRLKVLEVKLADQKQKLATERENMAQFLGALERLSMMPPEALLASPTVPIDKVRSSMLLRSAVPALKLRSEKLSLELKYLISLKDEILDNQKQSEMKRARLKAREDEITQLVQERKKLKRKVSEDRNEYELQMAQLASRAQDLKDLMAQVEAQRKATEARKRIQEKAARAAAEEAARQDALKRQELRAEQERAKRAALIAQGHGTWRMPVTGVIKTRFNQVDSYGGKVQGIILTPRSGAIIVAPASGTVKFAGTFRGYGRIVIIEHAKGYHSLIAGLGTIDVDVGHQVLAGEPVGATPTVKDIKPEVYYELRLKGKPINPEDRITVKHG